MLTRDLAFRCFNRKSKQIVSMTEIQLVRRNVSAKFWVGSAETFSLKSNCIFHPFLTLLSRVFYIGANCIRGVVALCQCVHGQSSIVPSCEARSLIFVVAQVCEINSKLCLSKLLQLFRPGSFASVLVSFFHNVEHFSTVGLFTRY